MAALTCELDTALHIAHTTEDPGEDEDTEDIYGHRTDDGYLIRPWNVIQNHATWLTQNYSIREAIAGGPNAPLSPDDYIEFWHCFKFQATVQDFEEVYIRNKPSARSILRDRMQAALSAPEEEEESD